MGSGFAAFGENYAQELVAKAAEVDLPDIAWHMIGHLQTNKARLVTPVVSDVHSVDSIYLAHELGKRAAKLRAQHRRLGRGQCGGRPSQERVHAVRARRYPRGHRRTPGACAARVDDDAAL